MIARRSRSLGGRHPRHEQRQGVPPDSAPAHPGLDSLIADVAHAQRTIPGWPRRDGVIATLKAAGVSPEAYVGVHAQNEPCRELHLRAAEQGAFVQFDGIAEDRLDESVSVVSDRIRRGHLEQILVSQNAGWYHVSEPGGGLFRPFVLATMCMSSTFCRHPTPVL